MKRFFKINTVMIIVSCPVNYIVNGPKISIISSRVVDEN